MRTLLTKDKLIAFFNELGRSALTAGNCYITGGATAVLKGWREMTVDIDLKFDPEPAGVFEALPRIKNSLQVNVKLASPEQFIPEVSGWRERSQYIGTFGSVACFHYDYVAQALSKLERGYDQDLEDVSCMLRDSLVTKDPLPANDS